MDNEGKDIETMSAEDCQSEIDTTLENAEHVYWGKPGSSRSQKRAVERMRQLHEKLYPQKGAEPHDALSERLKSEGIETVEDVDKLATEKKAESEEDEEDISLTEAQEEGFKKLKGEWGDEYETRLDEARGTYEGVMQIYGKDNPEFKELMESSLGNEPSVVKLFAEIAKQGREMQPLNCPHCGEEIKDEEED